MKTRRYVPIESPFTGGKVVEVCDVEQKTFRGETYPVHVRYYVCEDTGEQFTTTDQDTLWTNELYNQYRTRHGIPFPDQIRAIRARLGLSLSQITRLLGFGANQYAQYEAGQVPSESNGRMILAISTGRDLPLRLLDDSRHIFTDREYTRIRRAILDADTAPDTATATLYGDTRRSILNGFGPLDPERLADMVRYIIARCHSVCPTMLNKLMFYADFLHYRRYGLSISGLQYQAITYGPVPVHYATIYDNIPGIDRRIEFIHDTTATYLTTDADRFPNLADTHRETIDTVLGTLGGMTVQQLVNLSHTEPAWLNHHATHALIPYTEAFTLRAT